MSRQVRVTSLLPARKAGVSTRREAPARVKGSAVIDPAQSRAKPQQAQLDVEVTEDEPMTAEITVQASSQPTTPAAPATTTRLTRSTSQTRRQSLSPPTAISEEVQSSVAAAPAVATPIVVAAAAPPTPAKRKAESASRDADSTPVSKKARSGSNQAVTPAAAALPSAAVLSASEIDFDDAMPPAVEPDTSMSLDDPFFPLPALEPVPMAPPTVRGTPRGASLLSSSNIHVISRMPGGVGRAPVAPAPIVRLSAGAVASVRASNAMHSAVMDMLEDLAPTRPAAVAPAVATSAAVNTPTRTSQLPTSRALVAPAFPASSALSNPLRFGSSPAAIGGVLPFPTHFAFLIGVFTGLDSTLSMLLHRNRGADGANWHKELHESCERVVGKQVHLAHIQQLLSLYPTCYVVTERHYTDSFGKLNRDYKISFGSSNGGDEETESKLHLATMAALELSAADASRATLFMGQNANLSARRRELEQRMKQYVYQQHQAYLTQLQAAGSSSKADLGSIAAMLQTPLSRMPVWHPTFQVDQATHVTPLPLAALPDRDLTALLAAEAAKKSLPSSLKQLAMKKQAVPHSISLERENRGLPTSTNGGSAAMAAASSSAVATAAAPAPATAPPVSASKHRSLSVLSAEVYARLATNIHTSQVAALKADGDPALREELRKLTKLKLLYEAIKLKLKQEKNRANIPVPELLEKLRTNATDFGDSNMVRQLLGLLAQHLPHWCTIGKSSFPPVVDVLRTHRSGEVDPATQRDRNVPILLRLVEQQERRMRPKEEQDPAQATAVTADIPEVRVKIEADDSVPAAAASAATSLATAMQLDSVTVKQEEEAAQAALIANAAHRAADVHTASGARLTLAASPQRVSNVSARAHLLANSARPTRTAAPAPPAAANFALSHMR